MASDRTARELLVAGRTRYYANDMDGAVDCFRQALNEAESDDVHGEALLELAPALSKSGRPEEALRLLDDRANADRGQGQLGQIRHKRSIVLYELGRLVEAIAEMEGALELLAESGDRFTQAGVLVNLGAATSSLGRLAEAEEWYRQARELSSSASLPMQVAVIDGNLGYVASRRGRFAEALARYEQGRQGFRELGEAGLFLAVLEIDHARTLLDMGLAAEAVDVADSAVEATRAGANQMLEAQGLVLGAEARLRTGDVREGLPRLRAGIELAQRLTQQPLSLWAEYVAETLLPADCRSDLVADSDDDIDRFVEAGWMWEAHTCALQRAQQYLGSDRARAARLLEQARQWERETELERTAIMVRRLLQADLTDDADAATEALRQGLNATAEQQALVGSAELWWSLDSRVISLQNAALSQALRRSDPGASVLQVLEWTREVCYSRVQPQCAESEPDRWSGEAMVAAREARTALAEARMSGGDVRAASRRLLEIEREVLRSRRSEAGSGHLAVRDVAAIDRPDLGDHVVGVTYVAIDGTLYGLRQMGAATDLVDLGSPDPISANLRAQRTRLRRLADERRGAVATNIEALARINGELDRMLIEPLGLPDDLPVVVAPTIRLRDVAWAALPSLASRPITVTSSFTRWLHAPARVHVGSATALEGVDLEATAIEVEAVASAWPHLDVVSPATCRDAVAAFARRGLVHVAAHGTLRPDNAFFSAIEFADGPLTLLDMVSLNQLPTMMVLASCDAAAGVDAGQDAAVSTVNELLNHGVDVVVAPLVAVNDGAAADYAASLHRRLAEGASIDAATVGARQELVATGDPRRQAAAVAFGLYGGRCTASPLLMATPGDAR